METFHVRLSSQLSFMHRVVEAWRERAPSCYVIVAGPKPSSHTCTSMHCHLLCPRQTVEQGYTRRQPLRALLCLFNSPEDWCRMRTPLSYETQEHRQTGTVGWGLSCLSLPSGHLKSLCSLHKVSSHRPSIAIQFLEITSSPQ